MFIGQLLIKDGGDMISYLDQRLAEITRENKTATGIVISTAVRKELSRACQKVMGMPPNDSEMINRFRGVLLIEDGDTPDRLEVICGRGAISPVEGDPFNFGRGSGLRRIGQ